MRYKTRRGLTTEEWDNTIRSVVGNKLDGVTVRDGDLLSFTTKTELDESEKKEVLGVIQEQYPLKPTDVILDDRL